MDRKEKEKRNTGKNVVTINLRNRKESQIKILEKLEEMGGEMKKKETRNTLVGQKKTKFSSSESVFFFF